MKNQALFIIYTSIFVSIILTWGKIAVCGCVSQHASVVIVNSYMDMLIIPRCVFWGECPKTVKDILENGDNHQDASANTPRCNWKMWNCVSYFGAFLRRAWESQHFLVIDNSHTVSDICCKTPTHIHINLFVYPVSSYYRKLLFQSLLLLCLSIQDRMMFQYNTGGKKIKTPITVYQGDKTFHIYFHILER